jgi:hypothetical protein
MTEADIFMVVAVEWKPLGCLSMPGVKEKTSKNSKTRLRKKIKMKSSQNRGVSFLIENHHLIKINGIFSFLKKENKKSLLPFPVWGAGNASLSFLPLILLFSL